MLRYWTWLLVGVIVLAATALTIVTGKFASTNLPAIAVITVVTAIATVGVIEVAKRLFAIRGRFQRRAIEQWLDAGLYANLDPASIDAESLAMAVGEGRKSRVISDPRYWPFDSEDPWSFHGEGQLLSELLAALAFVPQRERDTLDLPLLPWFKTADEVFDLPLEQFTAQLSQAADRAVGDPDSYPALARSVAPRYIAALRHAQAEEKLAAHKLPNERDHERWDRLHPVQDPPFAKGSSQTLDGARAMVRQVRAEADGLAQRRVDSFQISTGRVWRRLITLATIASCAVIGSILCFLTVGEGYGAILLLSSTVSPILAWFVRDVWAGIERWRSS